MKYKLKYKLKFDKLLLFIYPWRDSLVLFVCGIPVRLGEILLSFFVVKIITSKGTINRREGHIILMLLFNLLLCILGIIINTSNIDIVFAAKYGLRNLFYILVLIGFLKTRMKFTAKDIDKLMDYVVRLEFFMLVIVQLTGIHIGMRGILDFDDIKTTGQYVMYGNIRTVRFMGTASEAGYLTPILLPPLFYFTNKYITKEKMENKQTVVNILLLLLCIVFTNSSAIYLLAVGIIFVSVFGHINRKRTQELLLGFVMGFTAIIIFMGRYKKVFYDTVINKINHFLGMNSEFDWSSTDRQQHLMNAWNMFCKSNWYEKIIGKGTGAYYFYSKNQTGLLTNNVEEAYNVYLSTLTDRGILGALFFVALFYYLYKRTIKKDLYSTSLFSGIVIQYIYWMLTGNMWLYFFWLNIIFLIGYYRFVFDDKEA